MNKELPTDDNKDAADMEISHGMVNKKEHFCFSNYQCFLNLSTTAKIIRFSRFVKVLNGWMSL